MGLSYDFVVYGLPGPQGSKKFVGIAKSTGRGILVESSKTVAPWREAVKHAALLARGDNPPLDGPLCVTMVFTLPKPKSAPKKKRTWPDRKPDLSKLVRSTEDALVSAGIIHDDARIIDLGGTRKVYPSEDSKALDCPGVRITISEITR